MKPLNTIPIESFLDKARIAIKSNQKSITLDIKEITALADSLSVVMTRMTGELDKIINVRSAEKTEIRMDGGGF
jgi:hypothetical protein